MEQFVPTACRFGPGQEQDGLLLKTDISPAASLQYSFGMHNGSGSASWFMEGLSLHAVGMGRIRIGNREWAQHKQNASTEASPVVAVAPKFEPSSLRRKGGSFTLGLLFF